MRVRPRSSRSRNSTAGTYPRPLNRGCADASGWLEFRANVGVDFAAQNHFFENRRCPGHLTFIPR
jgi:hypothetical protein